MPKKRLTETSPMYGSFLVSLLYRSIGLMSTGGQVPQHAATLDNVLDSIFKLPEINDIVAKTLERINSTSTAEWRRGVRRFLSDCLPLLSKACQELGKPDPLQELSQNKRVNFLLAQMGWKGSFERFASKCRKLIINKLDFILSGKKEAIAEWSKDITSGLFEDDPETAVAMIRLSLIAGGGRDLLEEVDYAVRKVRDRLNSSLEFQAAVELVEKRQEWGGSSSDRKFKESWKALRPKIMGRVRCKGLAIPEADTLSDLGKKSWTEEESLAMETVFEELLKRASENPFKLISNVWNGKLGNSLVLTVENDLRDAIRHQRAQKRDVAKQEILDEESLIGSEDTYPDSIDSKGPIAQLIEDDDYNEMIRRLNEEEKAIITMKMTEGLSQMEIARRLRKSQAWVSGRIKGIRGKLRPFYKE